ncbi:MAG: hypothetical protein JNL62_27175, partial [Bryobacterales bacterium]|nr:hypothetical protein [Bryobacterales bacterium]
MYLDWASPAARLLARLDLAASWIRLAGLPIALPAPLLAAFHSLDGKAAADLVESLKREAVTPLRRLKLIQLLVSTER